MSTIRFLNWSGLSYNHKRWPSGFSAPNAVFCGCFNGPVSDKIKQYPFAAFSDRFPGVAINVSAAAISLNLKSAETETATPEVYLSGKFIIPGIKSAEGLNIALAVLAHVWKFTADSS